MSKFELVKINGVSKEQVDLFDTFTEYDLYGELTDKDLKIKVHRIGPNRVMLEIPTDQLDREEHLFGLATMAIPLIKKGIKMYKTYADKKKKKTVEPKTFEREEEGTEEKASSTKIVEALAKTDEAQKVLSEYPAVKEAIAKNPELVTGYASEFLESAEESGDLDSAITSLCDELGQEVIDRIWKGRS